MASGLTSGSLTIIPPSNPITITGTSPATLYTVPAGKTLYITGGLLSTTAATEITLSVAGTPVLIAGFAAAGNTGLSGQPVLAASEGEAVSVSDSLAGTQTITLWGFLLP
jgi:uncharacterized protein with beta-barrel porin domain